MIFLSIRVVYGSKALNKTYFTNDPIFRSFVLKLSSTRILGYKAKAREGPRKAPKGGSEVVTFLFWVACTCRVYRID